MPFPPSCLLFSASHLQLHLASSSYLRQPARPPGDDTPDFVWVEFPHHPTTRMLVQAACLLGALSLS